MPPTIQTFAGLSAASPSQLSFQVSGKESFGWPGKSTAPDPLIYPPPTMATADGAGIVGFRLKPYQMLFATYASLSPRLIVAQGYVVPPSGSGTSFNINLTQNYFLNSQILTDSLAFLPINQNLLSSTVTWNLSALVLGLAYGTIQSQYVLTVGNTAYSGTAYSNRVAEFGGYNPSPGANFGPATPNFQASLDFVFSGNLSGSDFCQAYLTQFALQ